MKEGIKLHTVICTDSEEKMEKMVKFWEAILGCHFVYTDGIIKGYVPEEAYPRIMICKSDKSTTNFDFVLYPDEDVQNIIARLDKLSEKIDLNKGSQFITYQGVNIHLIKTSFYD